MKRDKLDQVVAFADKVLSPMGFECIEAEWIGNERVLRLFIDKPAGGIKIDDCVAVTKLMVELPELDVIVPGQYSLEVSSPGIERPLRSRTHFERHIGDTIQVKLAEKILDRKQGTGKLISVSNEAMVTLETSQGLWSFPLDQVQKASLVYDWN